MSDLKPYLAAVAAGKILSEHESGLAFEIMMSGTVSDAQIAGLLMALRIRGETVDEITGAARVMRAKAHMIEAPPGAIDTCGTGGDGAGTLNISTAAALVTAACGVPVAKHGNRAVSSKSGSADVLEALGVNIDAGPAVVTQSLWDCNFGFLLAPKHHEAMRHVMTARRELGVRTVFNLLGPLANPAGAKRQLVGVFSAEWLGPIAQVLANLGTEAAWIVHGSDGLDELTTTGPSLVAELRNGRIRSFEITPEDADLPYANPGDLAGGDAAENAEAIRQLIDGRKGSFRDVVLLNAAAALVVAEAADDLRDGVNRAAEAIDSGAVASLLSRLIEITAGRVPVPQESSPA